MNNELKIKVCGMRDQANIAELVLLAPDYIGFIFYPKSKRYIHDISNEILSVIPDRIKKTGVFVNENIDKLLAIHNRYQLDFVQLHGDEPVDYCQELKDNNINIIKAFGISESFIMSQINEYKPFCDFFLFDNFGKGYGGTGKKFAWEQLAEYDNDLPIFLSGGIGPEDVSAIQSLDYLNIHAIDINSGFETAPGMKNIRMIEKFMNQIKG